jgi:hypothetical protein
LFLERLQKIQAHNSKPGVTYQLAVQRHADLSYDEFIQKHTGAYPPNEQTDALVHTVLKPEDTQRVNSNLDKTLGIKTANEMRNHE